jgi:hypothetical protein
LVKVRPDERGTGLEYIVIDCRTEDIAPEHKVQARGPEHAAEVALGMTLSRGGHHRDLVCRVYWQERGTRNMVRLYDRANPR